jgi:hypothetical protein
MYLLQHYCKIGESFVFLTPEHLYRMTICCFMSGTFVQYTAGILNDYEGAMLFVALTEHPLLKTIFQKNFHDLYVQLFNMNEFKFTLIGIMPGYDVF